MSEKKKKGKVGRPAGAERVRVGFRFDAQLYDEFRAALSAASPVVPITNQLEALMRGFLESKQNTRILS